MNNLNISLFPACDVTGATKDPSNDNACNCPVDTYLDETADTPQCTSCLNGSSTNSARGAISVEQCCKHSIGSCAGPFHGPAQAVDCTQG